MQGKLEDKQKFNDYLNHPSRKQQILTALNFPKKKNAKILINPMEFVFDNFFKNNTLLLKIEFYCEEQMQLFLNLFDDFKKYLPPHVFIFVKLNIRLGYEQIDNWNSSFVINGELCGIDGGSVMPDKIGGRPGEIADLNYYKDYSNSLFCVSISNMQKAKMKILNRYIVTPIFHPSQQTTRQGQALPWQESGQDYYAQKFQKRYIFLPKTEK